MRMKLKAHFRILVTIVSMTLLILSSVSVTAWSGFHNDEFRTGHIDTDTSDITHEGLTANLRNPNNYVASPVAAPTYADYDSSTSEWAFGDWRVIATGDYCVVAYDEDLQRQWTFYTTQPVVATPTICILTDEKSPTHPSTDGARAVIVMTQGIVDEANGMIHVLNLRTGETILEADIPWDQSIMGWGHIKGQRFYVYASPISLSVWEDNQHGKVQIFYCAIQEQLYNNGDSDQFEMFCRIEMEYNTGTDQWEWIRDINDDIVLRSINLGAASGPTYSSPIIMDNDYIAFCTKWGEVHAVKRDDFWDNDPKKYMIDTESEIKYSTLAEVPTDLNGGFFDSRYILVGFDGDGLDPPGLHFIRMQLAPGGLYDFEIIDTIEFEVGQLRSSAPCMLTKTDVTRTVDDVDYDFGDELFPDAVFVTTTDYQANQVTKVRAISTTVEDVSGDVQIRFSDTQSNPVQISSGPNILFSSAPICSDSQLYVGVGQHMYQGDISFNGDQVSLTNMASFQSVGQGDSFSARPMLLEQTLTTTQGGSENCQGVYLYNVATDGTIYKWETDDTTTEPTDTYEWISYQSYRRIHDLARSGYSWQSYVNDRHPTVVREDVSGSGTVALVSGPEEYMISSPVVAVLEPNNQVWDPDHVIIQVMFNRIYGLNEDLTVRWFRVLDQVIKGTPVVFRLDDAVGELEYHKYAVFLVTYGEDWKRVDWGFIKVQNERPWEILLDVSDGSLIAEKQVFHDNIGQNLLGGAGPAPDENWFYVQSSPLHYADQQDQGTVTLHRLFFTVQYIYAIYPYTLGAEHIFCRLTVGKVNGEWKFIDDNMGNDPSFEKWREYGVPAFYDDHPCYSSPTWTVVDKGGQDLEPGMIAVGNNDHNIYFFNWNSFWTKPGDLRDFYPVDTNPAVILYSTGAYSEKEQSLFIGFDENAPSPSGYFETSLAQIDLEWGQFGQPWPWVKATIVTEEPLTYRYISSPCILPLDQPGTPEDGEAEYVFVLTTDMDDPEEVQHGGNPGMDSEIHMIDASAPAALTLVDSIPVFSGAAVFDGIPSSVICTNEQIYVGIGPEMYIGDIGNDQIDNWMMFFTAPVGTFSASPAIFLFTDNAVGLYRMVNMCTNGKVYKWME
jgi:hypothetical protein